MQVCKPDSVFHLTCKQVKRNSYHLSGTGVTPGIYRSTHLAPCRSRIGRATRSPESRESKTYLIFQPVRFAMPPMSPSGR